MCHGAHVVGVSVRPLLEGLETLVPCSLRETSRKHLDERRSLVADVAAPSASDRLGRELEHADRDDVLVARAVEDGDLPSRRKSLDVFQKPNRTFVKYQ
jgi:hypothetical protein